jgi:hypothetical protein
VIGDVHIDGEMQLRTFLPHGGQARVVEVQALVTRQISLLDFGALIRDLADSARTLTTYTGRYSKPSTVT